MPQKLILDVDTGTDDAVAIIIAVLHPELELLAVTTVNGNAPLAMTTENTLRVLGCLDADVPVYAGMPQPLARPDFPVPRAMLAERAGSYLDLPAAKSFPQESHAVDYLINTILSSDGDVAVVATAPLTNIAMALKQRPCVAEAIQELVVMGGTHAIGNITPAADFNVWADPEAARVVFQSGIKQLTLIPLDCTHQAFVSKDHCARLRAMGKPAAQVAATFIEERIEVYQNRPDMQGLDAAPIHDAFAVAALADPTLITTQPLHVDVETMGELTTGRTVIDFHHRSGKPANADVAVRAESAAFSQMLLKTFEGP